MELHPAFTAGNVVVITGAADGIGLAAAEKLLEMDNKRMEWAMGDLIYNRPALSRWLSDYEEEFENFMKG